MTLTERETACIGAFRQGATSSSADGDWISFGVSVMLEAGRMLRAGQHALPGDATDLKGDGSPVTAIEHEVESLLHDRLSAFEPTATFVGEETGGVLPVSGLAVAIDPVDGTWAFLTGTETYTCTLAVYRDGVPFLGVVANPTTGEIGYAVSDGPSRLLRLSLFGEPDVGYALPAPRGDAGKVLVNVHPSRSGASLVQALYGAWEQGRVQMVRSPGGSPAWALLEAAKGEFAYVNLWSKRPAAPYDLAAGVLLVRRAGGEVTDLRGEPVDAMRHEGPFVAAVEKRARGTVLEIAGEVREG